MQESLANLIDMLSMCIVLICVVLAMCIPLYLMSKSLQNDKKQSTPQDDKQLDIQEDEKMGLSQNAKEDEEYPYQKVFLLTKNEWNFYRNLKPITDKYRLHILSKVRMADIVQVKKGLSNKKYYSAFGKIKSKHIDFVLADPKNLRVYMAIELDDSSHNEVDRQQKDFFEDKVFETIGLPLIITKSIEGVEAQICEKLKIPVKQ